MKTNKQGGFTLLEMLLVVSIIILLMGISGAGVGKAITAARKTKARAETAELVRAWKAYRMSYTNWPGSFSMTPGGPPHVQDMDFETMQILLGHHEYNTNGYKFIDLAVGSAGMLDPWGTVYRVYFSAESTAAVEHFQTTVFFRQQRGTYMKTNRHVKAGDEKRRGVAILIVVAMLSSLMLMAVAFSISMRLERQGAANYRHSVMARQMLWSALSLAIEDLDSSLGGTNFTVYPQWNVLPSDSDGTNLARVITTDSMHYIPGSLHADVKKERPQWIPVASSDDAQVGRCAYLIANVSGLLDGNMVGSSDRAFGTSVAEMRASDKSDYDFACEDRTDTHHRYESLREMKKLNLALYDALSVDDGGEDKGFAHVFSSSIEGEMLLGADPYVVTNKINISDPSDKIDEIARALIDNLSFSEEYAAFFVASMIDYADEDSRLHPLLPAERFPNTEAIPMLNELQLEVGCREGSKSDIRLEMKMEFIYPYLNECKEEFTYDIKADGYIEEPGVEKVLFTLDKSDIEIEDVFKKKATLEPKFFGETQVIPASFVAAPTSTVNVVVQGSVTVKIKGTSDVVDSLPDFKFETEVPFPLTYTARRYISTKSREVADPRFNWRWRGWRETNSTWMAINDFAKEKLSDAAEDGYDDDYLFYVSNKGKIVAVGELGCILEGYGSKYYYKTLRLYGDPLTPKIFDLFTTATPGRRRGLINVNSDNADVWEAVLRDLPIGDPYDPVDTLPEDDVRRVADELATHIRGIKGDKDIGPLLDVSELFSNPDKRFDWEGFLSVDYDPDNTSHLERELMIASMAGLLTSRQNTFVILLSGEKFIEAAMGGGGGISMASMYGVATISRDPFRDPDTGKHNLFIRSFNVLSQ